MNSAPTGTTVISGDTIVGDVLTTSHELSDGNGLGILSYQWYRSLNSIKSAINLGVLIPCTTLMALELIAITPIHNRTAVIIITVNPTHSLTIAMQVRRRL